MLFQKKQVSLLALMAVCLLGNGQSSHIKFENLFYEGISLHGKQGFDSICSKMSMILERDSGMVLRSVEFLVDAQSILYPQFYMDSTFATRERGHELNRYWILVNHRGQLLLEGKVILSDSAKLEAIQEYIMDPNNSEPSSSNQRIQKPGQLQLQASNHMICLVGYMVHEKQGLTTKWQDYFEALTMIFSAYGQLHEELSWSLYSQSLSELNEQQCMEVLKSCPFKITLFFDRQHFILPVLHEVDLFDFPADTTDFESEIGLSD